MEIIYVDRLFLLNLLADYLLCLVSARVCGLCLKRRRYLLAALLGALYAVAVLLPGLAPLSGAAGKLAAAILMALIAYGGERRFWRCAGVFLAVSAAFGGAVWALSMAGGQRPGAVISGRVLLLSFALCYGALRLLFSRKAQLADRPRAEAVLRFLGRECRFMVLLDSGNSLSDPMSGCAVMLATPQALRPALRDAAACFEADPVTALEALSAWPELTGRFRLIPYRAVGAAGLLPVFRPEGLSLDGREEKELLVAVSPSAGGDGFDGIV